MRISSAYAVSGFSAAGLAVMSVLLAAGTTDFLLGGYLAYAALAALVAVGMWRPRAGYYAALALLPFDLSMPIPHAITSAPSSYLIGACALACLATVEGRQRLLKEKASLAIIGSFAVATLIGLMAALANEVGVGLKYQVAEALGYAVMLCFVIVPACLITTADDVDKAQRAIAAGLGVVLLGGVLGAPTTLLCLPAVDQLTPFASSGYRLAGLSPDPNRYGLAAAALLPFVVFARQATLGSTACFLLVVGIAFLVILSGSRTGLLVGILVAIACFAVAASMRRNHLALASAVALGMLMSAPFLAWQNLPCPLSRDKEVVRFAERNDTVAYMARQAMEDDTTGVASSAIDTTGAFSVVTLDGSRKSLWTFSFVTGVANLPFGIGIANMPAYTERGWRAHNTALTAFLELGIPGMIAILVVAFVSAWRAWRLIVKGIAVGRFGVAAAPIALAGIGLGALTQDMARAEILWGLVGFVVVAGARMKLAGIASSPVPERREPPPDI